MMENGKNGKKKKKFLFLVWKWKWMWNWIKILTHKTSKNHIIPDLEWTFEEESEKDKCVYIKAKPQIKTHYFYTGNYEETLPNIHPEEIYHLQMNEWIRELNQTGKNIYIFR